MTLNKYYLIIISIFFYIGCESSTQSENCSLNGIENTIQATSYTEWIYLSVTDTGMVELQMTENEIDRLKNQIGCLYISFSRKTQNVV